MVKLTPGWTPTGCCRPAIVVRAVVVVAAVVVVTAVVAVATGFEGIAGEPDFVEVVEPRPDFVGEL